MYTSAFDKPALFQWGKGKNKDMLLGNNCYELMMANMCKTNGLQSFGHQAHSAKHWSSCNVFLWPCLCYAQHLPKENVNECTLYCSRDTTYCAI